MSTKPYNIQSPEQIAKDCGYNKQVIAKCMQTGTVDPTAGVLAGLFIDRVRNAEQAGQGSTQTIAQQIFAPPAPPAGGIGMPPPAPSQAPMGAPAGLGATPEAAQMQAPMPEMPAPEMAAPAPTEEAPMGMAEGGLASLPIPDTMFDEPNNGGYADGGVVAFASGGPLGPYYEQAVLKAIPGTTVTSRQRSAAKNAQVGGVPDSYHKTDNARDFVPPKGMDAATFASLVKRTLGKGTDVINEGDHIHTEPGPKNNRVVAPMPRETDTTTAEGRGASLEDQIAFGNSMYAGLPREAMDRAKAAALEELDPENIAKEKRYTDAEAVMQAGFTLMSETGPLAASIAKAGATYIAARGASKKEQKAAKSAAVRELMSLEDIDRKTATAGVELGMEAYKVGLTAEQQQRALAFQEKQLNTTVSENAKDREVQMAAAMYRAQNPSDFDTKFAMYQKSYPGFSEVAILKQMKTDGLLGSSQAGMGDMPGVTPETGGAGGQQPVLLGSRPVQ